MLQWRSEAADGDFMAAQLAFILPPGEVWLVVAVIGFWLVIMCLKSLAHEMEYALRCHKLKVEVHTLRMQQLKRMSDLGMGRKKAGGRS